MALGSENLIQKLSSLPKVKLIENLYVLNVPENSPELNDIMSNKMCNDVKSLTFNKNGSKLDVSYYLNSLKKACSKVAGTIYLAGLEVNISQFNKIIKS